MTGVDPNNFENFRESLKTSQTQTCKCGHEKYNHYREIRFKDRKQETECNVKNCSCKKFEPKILVIGIPRNEKEKKVLDKVLRMKKPRKEKIK